MFPVLMILMVWRTIVVRVKPDELLVFRLKEPDDHASGSHHPDQNAQQQSAHDNPESACSTSQVSVARVADEEGSLKLETTWDRDPNGNARLGQNGEEMEVLVPRKNLWAEVRAQFLTQGRF